MMNLSERSLSPIYDQQLINFSADSRESAEKILKSMIREVKKGMHTDPFLEVVAGFVKNNRDSLEKRVLQDLARAFKAHGNKSYYQNFISKLRNDHAAPTTQKIPLELLKTFFDFCNPQDLKSIPRIISKTDVYLHQLNQGRCAYKTFVTSRCLLAFLKEQGKSVKKLNCSYLYLVDQDLQLIICYCPHLMHLNLVNCYEITGQGSTYLIALTRLQSLNLAQCQKIKDQELAQLTALKQLQTLNLKWCKKITDTGLAQLKALKQLQALNLKWCKKITDTGLAQFTALTQLRSLNLTNCKEITNQGLAQLTALMQLQSLNLANCVKITDEGLAQLTALTQLRLLDLAWCEKTTDKGLSHLRVLTCMQSLNLTGYKEITDEGLTQLKTLTRLHSLNLSYCVKITDQGLAHLVALTQLHSLNLQWSHKMTGDRFTYLKIFPQLQMLQLPGEVESLWGPGIQTEKRSKNRNVFQS